VTEGGEALLFGRTHDFGNTLRIVNMNRTMNWMARAVNAVSDVVWKTDLSPCVLEMEDGGPTPSFRSVACSPGALTAFVTGLQAWVSAVTVPVSVAAGVPVPRAPLPCGCWTPYHAVRCALLCFALCARVRGWPRQRTGRCTVSGPMTLGSAAAETRPSMCLRHGRWWG
jgi:hypothetical protein